MEGMVGEGIEKLMKEMVWGRDIGLYIGELVLSQCLRGGVYGWCSVLKVGR